MIYLLTYNCKSQKNYPVHDVAEHNLRGQLNKCRLECLAVSQLHEHYLLVAPDVA